MILIPHRFPNISANIWLPDWIQVEVKLIKNARFYSNTPSKAHVKTTWHDTGNPNTNANQEWTWANNGRQGAGVGGYNGIYDDTKIIITQDFATEVWAAGTPVGNKTSYHFEQAWGGTVDFEKSLEVGAALHGAICAAKGWDVAEALVQHHAWYGKDCPGQIRRKGIWPQVVAMTTAAAIAARAAESGAPVPKPVPVNLPAKLFGTAKGYSYNPTGPVSDLWLEAGQKSGRYPRLIDVLIDGNVKSFVFGDGSVIVADGNKPVAYLTQIAA